MLFGHNCCEDAIIVPVIPCFSLLLHQPEFCVWTSVTCEDLARKSSVPTRRALLVKPTLLGWCSSPFVQQRTVQAIGRH